MSKPWGGIGAWAADAERAEAEERENLAKNPPFQSHRAAAAESESFPSLSEALTVKPKKKKPVAMSLSEFTVGTHVGPGGAARRDSPFESKRLTPDEMLRLPTGPRERSADEMEYGKLGGGFKSYGTRSSGPGGGGGRVGRGDEGGGDGSWGGGGGGRRSYGGFDDERRSTGPPSRGSDFDLPSRADEVDNWAMSKKPMASTEFGRQDRYGGPGDSGRQDRYSSLGGGSKADEVDNWASLKKAVPVRSASNFGSGFRDPVAREPDRWSRGEPLPPREGDLRDRPRLVLDPRKGDGSSTDASKANRPSPFGAARPREEILAEKGLDWKKLDSETEVKRTSRPTSSQSSRPSSAQSNRPVSPAPQVLEVQKPRPKVNPFGDAKPREVLLEEKGKDWRKIDFELEHRSVDRPETMEEQVLKEEINHLRQELEKEATINGNGAPMQGSGAEQTGLHDLILSKEKELELLIQEFDDKVRFGQKASERPGSGAGRSTGFLDRPPSQSGMSDEFRNVEYVDRPQSRGTGDVRTRNVDDRRAFQGGREGGFFSSRDDRPRSRDRW